MKCEKCHVNEATVFITQNINGESREMNLCESCAAEQEQPLFDEAFSFQQFLTGFMENSQPSNPTSAQMDIVLCPGCGMSLQDFKQNSKVGCAKCYKTFGSHLYPVVKRLHGTVRHTGKVPGRIGEDVKAQQLLEQYEGQLKIALMKEDYESAARFRDKIRELKQEGRL